MRPYLIIFSCILLVSVSSCKRDFDCKCTTRGARTEYVETIKAENKDAAHRDCAAYMNNINQVSLPGVDCHLADDE
jgi:hypothetical protein